MGPLKNSLMDLAMDRLSRLWWLALGASAACTPVDVVVYRESGQDETATGNDTAGSTERPDTDSSDFGSGGGATTTGDEDGVGGENGVEPLPVIHVLDDFEDGDTKAFDPGGWWYTVNDGTGQQSLGTVSTAEAGVPPQDESSSCLATQSSSFEQWGSAFGVDIAMYEFVGEELELSFLVAADRPVRIELHAIDGSGHHFTRAIAVTTAWAHVSIRLDSLFIVEGDSVQRLDVETAEELQWFVFEFEPVTVWIDDVVLRSSSMN